MSDHACQTINKLNHCCHCGKPWKPPGESSFAAPSGSVALGVITELNLLRDWIKDGSGYNRDDAPDEIARAIANRIREIEARETTKPLND